MYTYCTTWFVYPLYNVVCILTADEVVVHLGFRVHVLGLSVSPRVGFQRRGQRDGFVDGRYQHADLQRRAQPYRLTVHDRVLSANRNETQLKNVIVEKC